MQKLYIIPAWWELNLKKFIYKRSIIKIDDKSPEYLQLKCTSCTKKTPCSETRADKTWTYQINLLTPPSVWWEKGLHTVLHYLWEVLEEHWMFFFCWTAESAEILLVCQTWIEDNDFWGLKIAKIEVVGDYHHFKHEESNILATIIQLK